METTKTLIIIGCLFLFAMPVGADEHYLGVSTGWVSPVDVTIDDQRPINLDYEKAELSTGVMGGIKIGYRPVEGLAYELEYNYLTGLKTDEQLINPVVLYSSKTTIQAMLFNIILRTPPSNIHFYSGFGVGLANTQLDDVQISTTTKTSDSYTTFAVQLLTGVEFDITEQWFATLGYKYFYTAPDFSALGFDAIYRLHMITAGLNYTF